LCKNTKNIFSLSFFVVFFIFMAVFGCALVGVLGGGYLHALVVRALELVPWLVLVGSGYLHALVVRVGWKWLPARLGGWCVLVCLGGVSLVGGWWLPACLGGSCLGGVSLVGGWWLPACLGGSCLGGW